MDRRTESFNANEYEDLIKEYTTDQLNEELSGAKERLEELCAEYETNRNMIDKYIDEPGYEHLLDMSILHSAKPIDIKVTEVKIELLENELKIRELA